MDNSSINPRPKSEVWVRKHPSLGQIDRATDHDMFHTILDCDIQTTRPLIPTAPKKAYSVSFLSACSQAGAYPSASGAHSFYKQTDVCPNSVKLDQSFKTTSKSSDHSQLGSLTSNSSKESFTSSVPYNQETLSKTALCVYHNLQNTPVLNPYRKRTFYGREWIFQKILTYTHFFKQPATRVDPPTVENQTSLTKTTNCDSTTEFNSQHVQKMVLVGNPGSGKTSILRHIVDSTERAASACSMRPLSSVERIASHVLGAYFCCAQLPGTLDPVKFVQSLHHQLMNARSPIGTYYSEATAARSSQLILESVTKSADYAFRHGVLNTLNSLESKLLSVDSSNTMTRTEAESKTDVNNCYFLLVDGIDEPDHVFQFYQSYENSEPTTGQCTSILQLLINNLPFFPSWICLLLTCSRQNREIISHLFPGIRRISLDDLHKSTVSHDVQQYVLYRLAVEPTLQQAFYAQMHSDILGTLHIKSSACFLYIEILLDAISESWITPDQLAYIPGTLHGLFLWLCQYLFVVERVNITSDAFSFPRLIFNVLLAAHRTLTEFELYTILTATIPDLSMTTFKAHLESLRPFLLTLTPEEEQTLFSVVPQSGSKCYQEKGLDSSKIHFIHSSFSNWLVDAKHCTALYLCNRQRGVEALESASWFLDDYIDVETSFSTKATTSLKVFNNEYTSTSSSLNASEQNTLAMPTFGDQNTIAPDQLDSSYYCYTDCTNNYPRTTLPLGDLTNSKDTSIPGNSIVLASRKGDFARVRSFVESGADVNQLDDDGWSALRTAAWHGHSDIVTLLLDHGADVNLAGPDGRGALRGAAWAGHEQIVRKLLDAGANVDMQDAEGRSPLIAAAYMGHVRIVELLAQAGADLDRPDEDGRTALHVAAFCIRPSENHHEVVTCLLECGANPNVFDSEGITPLLGAARVGNRAVCELCLEADTDVNQIDRYGNTALTLAILGGHTDVVRLLLFWGCAVDSMDAAGWSLLSLAAAIGDGAIVNELLARGLDEAHRDHTGRTPLHLAAAGPHSVKSIDRETNASADQYCEVIRILIDGGARLDEVDNAGRTPLLVACEHLQIEAVQLLISYAPPNSSGCNSPSRSETAGSAISSDVMGLQPRCSYGVLEAHPILPLNRPSLDHQTPLRAAALANNADLVRLLLCAGADPDYQDANGRTTLYLLALDNMLDMADLLLHTRSPGAHSRPGSAAVIGANPTLSDDEGRCPLHVASWQGHLSMIKLLLQAGTPVDIRDREGRTPLHLASWQGHAAVCQLLLKEGNARVDAVCSQGATSLCIAAQEGHMDVCSVLLKCGANPFQADDHGRTPFRVAFKSGHQNVCNLLEMGFTGNAPEWPPRHVTPDNVVTQQYKSSYHAKQSYTPEPHPQTIHPIPQSNVPTAQIGPSTTQTCVVFSANEQPDVCYQSVVDRIPVAFTVLDRKDDRACITDVNPYARPPGPLAVRNFHHPVFINHSPVLYPSSKSFCPVYVSNMPFLKCNATVTKQVEGLVHSRLTDTTTSHMMPYAESHWHIDPSYPTQLQSNAQSLSALTAARSSETDVTSVSPHLCLPRTNKTELTSVPSQADAPLDESNVAAHGQQSPVKISKQRTRRLDQPSAFKSKGISCGDTNHHQPLVSRVPHHQQLSPLKVVPGPFLQEDSHNMRLPSNVPSGFYPDILSHHPDVPNYQHVTPNFPKDIPMDVSYSVQHNQNALVTMGPQANLTAQTTHTIVSPFKRREKSSKSTEKNLCKFTDKHPNTQETSPRHKSQSRPSQTFPVEAKSFSAMSTLVNMFGLGCHRIKKVGHKDTSDSSKSRAGAHNKTVVPVTETSNGRRAHEVANTDFMQTKLSGEMFDESRPKYTITANHPLLVPDVRGAIREKASVNQGPSPKLHMHYTNVLETTSHPPSSLHLDAVTRKLACCPFELDNESTLNRSMVPAEKPRL